MLIWATPMIKGFVRVHTMVPIVVFGFVGAKSRFVPIHIEHNGIDRFQVDLKPSLKGKIILLGLKADLLQVLSHAISINRIHLLSYLSWDVIEILKLKGLGIASEIRHWWLSQAWQIGGIIQNGRDRRGWIISTLGLINASKFFKKSW